jgi:2-amino-4-hydroxy-6-hydroxymethyldihydropteridine diphosphokinase
MPAFFECLIAFGSNVGNSLKIHQATANQLRNAASIEFVASSRALITKAVGGAPGQPDYLNAAFRIRTQLTALELHLFLAELEQRGGRVRNRRWEPRTLDLDLLLYGNQQVRLPQLTVPHPRMSIRQFVLRPAVEIAAEMIHPVSNQTLSQLLEHLQQKPNCLVWAAEHSSESRQIAKSAMHLSNQNLNLLRVRKSDRPEQQAWRIACVDDLATFQAEEKSAKLVVWSFPRPKSLQEIRFSGPQMELDNPFKDQSANESVEGSLTEASLSSAEKIKLELVAAMEASSGE